MLLDKPGTSGVDSSFWGTLRKIPVPNRTRVGVTTGDSGIFLCLSSVGAGSWSKLPRLWGGLCFVTGEHKASEGHSALGFCFLKAGTSLGVRLGVLVGEGRES